MAKKIYYRIYFSDFTETVGFASSISKMRADANLYIKMWNLDIAVQNIQEITEDEYKASLK